MYNICITMNDKLYRYKTFESYNNAKKFVDNVCGNILNCSMEWEQFDIKKNKLIHETIITEQHVVVVIAIVNLRPVVDTNDYDEYYQNIENNADGNEDVEDDE